MSAQRPGEFDITIKVYPGGRSSGFLDCMQIGEEVRVFKKSEKQRSPGDLVGIVAYGIGITEALPVAISELARPDAKRVALLWSSQSSHCTFWHDDIAKLRADFGERFAFSHIFSRESIEGSFHGRVNEAVLREFFGTGWGVQLEEAEGSGLSEVRLLSIGTKEMIKDTEAMFCGLGFPMPQHCLHVKK